MQLLLLDEDAIGVSALGRALHPARVEVVGTRLRAREQLARPWNGYVLAESEAGSIAYELVHAFRAAEPLAPVAVVGRAPDAATHERCVADGLWCFRLSSPRERYAKFLAACAAYRGANGRSTSISGTRRSVAGVLRDYADARALTRRERSIVELAMRGLDRQAICAELGIEIKTYENHASNLLAKDGSRNVAEVALAVWRAFGDDSATGGGTGG